MINNISMIVATDDKNGIGKENDLAWHLSEDLKNFKSITTTKKSNEENVVIMGRNTWESIPKKYKPLPDRINCVITRNKDYNTNLDAYVFNSIEKAIEHYSKLKKVYNIFIIGGAQIYNYSIKENLIKQIFLTKVKGDFKCDIKIDKIPKEFSIIKEDNYKISKNGLKYKFLILENK